VGENACVKMRGWKYVSEIKRLDLNWCVSVMGIFVGENGG